MRIIYHYYLKVNAKAFFWFVGWGELWYNLGNKHRFTAVIYIAWGTPVLWGLPVLVMIFPG